MTEEDEIEIETAAKDYQIRIDTQKCIVDLKADHAAVVAWLTKTLIEALYTSRELRKERKILHGIIGDLNSAIESAEIKEARFTEAIDKCGTLGFDIPQLEYWQSTIDVLEKKQLITVESVDVSEGQRPRFTIRKV